MMSEGNWSYYFMSRQPFKPLATRVVAAPKKVKEAQVFIPKSSKKPFGGSSKAAAPSNLKKRSIAHLFDDDDDEDDVLVQQPPKKPLIKLLQDEEDIDSFVNVQQLEKQEKQETTHQSDNDDDPLDMFMTDIAKEPLASNEHKGRREDIENEDDFETFVKHREEELRNNPELAYAEEDYNSDDEGYLESIREDQAVISSSFVCFSH